MSLLRALRIIFNTTVLILLAPITVIVMMIIRDEFREDVGDIKGFSVVMMIAFLAFPTYVIGMIAYHIKPLREPTLNAMLKYGFIDGNNIVAKRPLYMCRSLLVKGDHLVFLQTPNFRFTQNAEDFILLTQKVCKPIRE